MKGEKIKLLVFGITGIAIQCLCDVSLMTKLENVFSISAKIFIANFIKSLNDYESRWSKQKNLKLSQV